jgi:hypothetical protein
MLHAIPGVLQQVGLKQHTCFKLKSTAPFLLKSGHSYVAPYKEFTAREENLKKNNCPPSSGFLVLGMLSLWFNYLLFFLQTF